MQTPAPIPGSIEWLARYPNAPLADVPQAAPQPVTVDFAVNVRHTYRGDKPNVLERASVTFTHAGAITIRNRSGSELMLDSDAAVALAILLRDRLLIIQREAAFGSLGVLK